MQDMCNINIIQVSHIELPNRAKPYHLIMIIIMSSSTDNDIEQLPTAKIDENVTYLFPTHNVHLALCELFSELEYTMPCIQ